MAEVVAESMVGGTTFHREVISVRFPEPWSSTSLAKTTVLKRRGRGLSLTEPSLLSRGTLFLYCPGLIQWVSAGWGSALFRLEQVPGFAVLVVHSFFAGTFG